jgi:hypothetical protein
MDSFEQEIVTDEQWDSLNDHIQPFRSMLDSISNEQLGDLIREYVSESDHGGWDGFSFGDMLGIAALLSDVALYQKNRLEVQ